MQVGGTTFTKFACESCKFYCEDKKSYEAHVRTITHQVNVKYEDVVAEREAKNKVRVEGKGQASKLLFLVKMSVWYFYVRLRLAVPLCGRHIRKWQTESRD